MNNQYSSLSKQKYLTALRRCFSSPFAVFDERVTGMILGPFFAVAHYQAYEWNRKITSECNRAYGLVRENDGQLEICYFRWKGLLAPGWVLFYTLVSRLMLFIAEGRSMPFLSPWEAWGVSVLCGLMVGVISAVQCWFTEAGMLGAGEVEKLLSDPENYYC